MAETSTSTAIDPQRATELIAAGAQLIDVRGDDEYEAGHVEGSRHIRLDLLTAEARNLDRDRPVVFYCRAGNRSDMPADAFRMDGWDAHHIAGGLVAWAEAGLPLAPDGGRVAERANLPGA
jgi:rhodanese-related sulfurtransferase